MGPTRIYAEATQPERDGMSTYTVFVCPRNRLEQYVPVVFSGWLKSLRFGNDFYRLMDQGSYFKTYHRFIQGILERPETEIRLAVLTDDPDVVLGFSVSRGTVLDYIYVNRDYRRLGIGRRLVPEGITTITHLTRIGLALWGSGKLPGVKFDPFS